MEKGQRSDDYRQGNILQSPGDFTEKSQAQA